ncbi:MAG: Gfo/Idh/MocA family protein [Ancrocorticia sp.]|uniref:Gfo/Idh/MocA family protein n=2 Tax=Ancrocorticia sp. TaxID=2593684 RepID=UPI003F8E4D6A
MVRMGIVGTNYISEWFITAALRTDGKVEPAAIYSRTQERAEEFAKEHEIELAFSDFDQMVQAVDAVYIASPTGMHHAQALRALDLGRHVLVEKTMGASLSQEEGIFRAAKERGLVAMEAMRHLHTPHQQIIRDALARIGTLRYVDVQMFQYSGRYDKFREGTVLNAFRPELGNSAIADIGVYCLEFALDLFGEPNSYDGNSVYLPNGFEGAGSVQFVYDSMLANVSYSKIVQGTNPTAIYGEDGSITVNYIGEPSRIELHTRRGTEILLDVQPSDEASGMKSAGISGQYIQRPSAHQSDQMHHELITFAAAVESGRIDPRWEQTTLAAREIMDRQLARAPRRG